MANLADYRVLLGVKEDSSGETIYAAYESRVADLERSPLSTEEKGEGDAASGGRTLRVAGQSQA